MTDRTANQSPAYALVPKRRLDSATADQILAAISAAMKAHDMPAVAALIRVFAVKEPRIAEIMLDAIHLATP